MKTALALIALALIAHAEPVMEKQLLFGGATTKGWSPAESTVEVSAARVKVNPTALHWHVTVDYHAGEAKYPIGWPRFGRAIPEGAIRDWSGWDFLHLWVYTTSSRPALPREPVGLGLHVPDRANAYSLRLKELKLNEWVEIKIPIAKIPRPNDVRHIQFHISESDYKHHDKLDLFIDDLALLRYARPTILDFAAEQTVIFADAPAIAARFQLSGVKPGDTVPITCELRRAGKVMACSTAQATRGPQRISLTPGKKLAPGNYELTALGGEATVRVRVVESPWR
ncbi:MAG: hypothetical protein FJ395_02495 [Verrucomicrobia bacterium]|nr:hypothetical protein [Verrucomicrobiota bacterium]